jgi:hypothetical protein
MNDRIEIVSIALREAITSFLVPIQTTRVIKDAEFERLYCAARELVVLLKGHDLVSKSLLNEFYAIMQVLRAEAPYFGKEQSKLQVMADQVELCFGLILEDETFEEQVSGVPRVV